jgi:hypothetical protein
VTLIPPELRRLILWPALITLAVTLSRLTGELMRAAPALFNRESGGPFAIVGIVWLIPVFGIYFAIRLVRSGAGPASAGRAIRIALLGLVLMFGLGFFAGIALGLEFKAQLLAAFIFSAAGAALQFPAWPELARALCAYGIAARVPVALIIFLSMAFAWGTHYDAAPPEMPEMGLIAKFLWIGLIPQLVTWVAFTIIVGQLFGAIAAAVTARRPS